MKLKHGGRPFRSLEALARNGSTTRVLNLAGLAASCGHLPGHAAQPFFKAPLLNRAIILKHRLRENDPELVDGRKSTATKVIIPLDPANLASGGASFLVGQQGWMDMVEEVSETEETFDRDRALLDLLDDAPSFDPFLLREQLRRQGFRPADCYFFISPNDRDRMRRFVEAETARLIDLAYDGSAGSGNYVGRLVEILLASDTDERLDPLRITLRLEGDSYRDGIFAWKGFLYYKWALSTLMDSLGAVMPEIGRLDVLDSGNAEIAALVADGRTRLQRTIERRCMDISAMLGAYDAAFASLTERGDAVAFREFLLRSPAMFLELGERVGMISHIASYWRFRFPPGAAIRAGAAEVLDLLQDFQAGLSPTAARFAA